MSNFRRLLAGMLVAGVRVGPLHAQPAAIIEDIRQVPDPRPGRFAAGIGTAGSLFFFVGCDDRHGCELWASDGTLAGSRMVKDILPGSGNAFAGAGSPSNPYFTLPAAVFGARVFFVADDGTRGAELWSSDGTEAGTHLVKDIRPGSASSQPSQLTPWGGWLFFAAADDGVHGRELWRTDGTEAGTLLVADVSPGPTGSEPESCAGLGSLLLFSADDGSNGRELWRTDGTAGGTVLVADIQPGTPGSSPGGLLTVGTQVFFSADDGVVGRELWVSDGSGAGTRLVKDIGSPSYWPSSPKLVGSIGGVAAFLANDNFHGEELWRSDGTADGTFLIGDLNAGPGDCRCADFVPFGGALFFRAEGPGVGLELWKTDGTPAGTQLVRDIAPGPSPSSPSSLTVVGGTLFFVASGGSDPSLFQLWKSDGTSNGTQLVRDFAPTRSYDGSLQPFEVIWGSAGGALALGADDGTNGLELWKSDGTAAGTSPLTDRVSVSSNPAEIAVFGGQWYFGADDGVHGRELWRSDGTAAGTVLVKDIRPGPESSSPQALFAADGVLLLSADDGVHGRELWRTDATEAGTILVKDLLPGSTGLDPKPNGDSAPRSFAKVGDKILFLANGTNAFRGRYTQVWRTDGTAAGTVLVRNAGYGEFLSDLIAVNGQAFVGMEFPYYLWGSDPVSLWVTDGTPDGTRTAATLRSSSHFCMAAFDGALYFLGHDSWPWDPGTFGLWRTDGSGAPKALVSRLPHPEPWFGASPSPLVSSGSRLFFVIEDSTSGRELWTSDGTEAGTHLVTDINPGPASSSPAHLVDFGGTLLFTGEDGLHGRELWRTDGTVTGTVMGDDIHPGLEGSLPSEATLANGQAYFSADDGTHGTELWRTDGATTELVQDIVVGAEPSRVDEMAAGPLGLLLDADDGVHGAEPWLIPPSELPPALAVWDGQVTRPASGQALLHLTVTLSAPVLSAVTVAYTTVDGTAIAGRDYVAASGTLTFAPGATSHTIEVVVLGGSGGEARRTLGVRLASPSGAALSRPEGTGTILSDVVPVVRSFTIDPVIAAGPGQATLTWFADGAAAVTLSGVPGVFGAAGTLAVAFTGTTRYALTATSPAGTSQAFVTVNVLPSGGAGLAAPQITAPTYPYESDVAGVTFAWTPVGGAAGYDLRLFDTTTGATVFSGSLLGPGSTSTLIVLPEGEYLFAVRACTTGGFTDATCGPFSVQELWQALRVSLVRPTAAPTVTSPLNGAALTASTQTLSWTAVSPDPRLADLFYEVLLSDVGRGTTALQITVPSPDLSTIFTMPSGSYGLKVRACQAGCGPWSGTVSFTVSLAAVPAGSVPGLGCVVSGGNSLTCSWGAVARADAYQVQVVQAPPAGPGGGALTVAAKQVSETTVTLPVPAGAATVFLAACNGDGCGPFATVGIVAGGPNPGQANIGTPMAGTVVSGPGVLFTWNRVPGDTGTNTWYRLFVQDLSRQATALDVFTTSNYYSAYFKAEGARYDALVVSNTGLASQVTGPAQGFNVSGSSATAPTLVSPAHNSTVGSGSIQLGWSPVPGATLYEYFVAVLGQGSATARGVTPGLLAQVPLTGSGGGTVYSGIVRACPAGATCASGSDAGWGPWSNAPGGPGVTNFTVAP